VQLIYSKLAIKGVGR